MNFSSSSITFNNFAVASATNSTALAAGKVAQYDSTAVSSVSTTAGNVVAGGETDSVSGIETVIGSGLNDYIVAASTGMTITGGAGADKMIGGAGADIIFIAAGDSDFGTITSPAVAVILLADIITLAAGDIINLTGALATDADYDNFTEVAAGGTITAGLTTNEVGQFVGVYDNVTGNFTSSTTLAAATASTTDVDALFFTYALADATDTTATEGLIVLGLSAQVDSAILNGVITFA